MQLQVYVSHGIGRPIVCDINKNKGSLKEFSQKMTEMEVKEANTMNDFRMW